MKNYNISNGIQYDCNYHIVWCSKYKRHVLLDDVKTRFDIILRNVMAELPVQLHMLRIDSNFVYLYIGVDPQYSPHKVVKTLKRESSRILCKEFLYLTTKLPTLWSNSYFISTAEFCPYDDILSFIANQKTSQRDTYKLG